MSIDAVAAAESYNFAEKTWLGAVLGTLEDARRHFIRVIATGTRSRDVRRLLQDVSKLFRTEREKAEDPNCAAVQKTGEKEKNLLRLVA